MKQIIEKWYKKLQFPSRFDKEFYLALDRFEEENINVDSYDLNCKDGAKNLLSYLYMCEETEKLYLENGISNEILVDTLKDIVIWCENWSKVKGELYLGELAWLKTHLKMKIFKIGRLQFNMAKLTCDIPKHNLKIGDNVVVIHVPRGEKLEYIECIKSIEKAKEFFKLHYPNYKYKAFTCCSWLLDETLKEFLPVESNILRYASMFDYVSREEVFALLKYVFSIDTTIENLNEKQPTSSFAGKIQQAVLTGKKFYEVLGVIPKD